MFDLRGMRAEISVMKESSESSRTLTSPVNIVISSSLILSVCETSVVCF